MIETENTGVDTENSIVLQTGKKQGSFSGMAEAPFRLR